MAALNRARSAAVKQNGMKRTKPLGAQSGYRQYMAALWNRRADNGRMQK